MILLNFYVAIALYSLIFISIIFILWLLGAKQKEKDLSLDERYIWFCSICSYTYVNTKEEIISVCPRCGSYNKKSSE